MKPVIVNFVRDDGMSFEAVEGTVFCQVLDASERHKRVGMLGKPGKPSGEPAKPDLAKMKKAQLVAYAESIGVKVVPDEMTNKAIIAAIEAAQTT